MPRWLDALANYLQASDDEDDEWEEDDEDDEEDEDEDGDVEMVDEEDSKKKSAPSKRKKQQADEVLNADSESTEPSVASTEDDESETDTAAPSVVDDGLPHPRVGYILFSLHTCSC